MDFILEKPAPIKAKIYGEELFLNRPTVEMIEDLNEKLEGASDKQKFAVTRGFLVGCGVREELLKKISMDGCLELVEFLSTPKKK